MSDMDILKGLLHSVYVTPEQRGALVRAMMALADVPSGHHPPPVVLLRRPGRVTGGPSSDVAGEDERHALLGPCGAE